MNTIERGAMTGVLSRAGYLTTLAVISAVAAPLLPSDATAQVRMTVRPQSEPIALQGATIHTVTNGVIENGTIRPFLAIGTGPGAEAPGTRLPRGRGLSPADDCGRADPRGTPGDRG